MSSTLQQDRPMPAAGRSWTAAERRLLRLIERKVGTRWGHCYGSAQRATLYAVEFGTGPYHFTYCEGFARMPELPAPFEHAWCLLNGQVWEPTPQFRGRRLEYVGHEIPTTVLRRAVACRRAWGPVTLIPIPAIPAGA